MLIPFFGRDLVDVGSRISDFHFHLVTDAELRTNTARKELASALRLLKQQCRKFGWHRLEYQTQRAIKACKTEPKGEVLSLLDQLEMDLLLECNNHIFFVLPEKYRHLVAHWPGQVPFGVEVRDRFPRSCLNIDASSRCLAFGLPTACVFHLMGVMQEGINAVAKDLGAPVLFTSTWEDIISPLAKKREERGKAMGREAWKRVEPFYEEALSDLRSVKNAWRNPTMHFTRNYTEPEAQKAFDKVEAFMAHIATRLRQSPAPKYGGV